MTAVKGMANVPSSSLMTTVVTPGTIVMTDSSLAFSATTKVLYSCEPLFQLTLELNSGSHDAVFLLDLSR